MSCVKSEREREPSRIARQRERERLWVQRVVRLKGGCRGGCRAKGKRWGGVAWLWGGEISWKLTSLSRSPLFWECLQESRTDFWRPCDQEPLAVIHQWPATFVYVGSGSRVAIPRARDCSEKTTVRDAFAMEWQIVCPRVKHLSLSLSLFVVLCRAAPINFLFLVNTHQLLLVFVYERLIRITNAGLWRIKYSD